MHHTFSLFSRSAFTLGRTAALVTLLAVSGLALTGWTASNESSAQPAATATAKKIRIGVSVPAATHGWTAGASRWAKRAIAVSPNIEFVYATAPGAGEAGRGH